MKLNYNKHFSKTIFLKIFNKFNTILSRIKCIIKILILIYNPFIKWDYNFNWGYLRHITLTLRYSLPMFNLNDSQLNGYVLFCIYNKNIMVSLIVSRPYIMLCFLMVKWSFLRRTLELNTLSSKQVSKRPSKEIVHIASVTAV